MFALSEFQIELKRTSAEKYKVFGVGIWLFLIERMLMFEHSENHTRAARQSKSVLRFSVFSLVSI